VGEKRRHLTDAETWDIINSFDESDSAIAGRLGVKVPTVHAARWRLARNGWTCRVHYTVCLYCGEQLTRRGSKTGKQLYHTDCREHVRTEWNARREPMRWESTPTERQQLILQRGHQHTERWQAETLDRATQGNKRWQEWENALILDSEAAPDHVLALELNRTLMAVRGRRRDLKKRRQTS
jgi:hypothetical protein